MPHKQHRKIIKVGNTSFAVILPKGWIKFYNLDDDGMVEVISDSNVVIKPLNGRSNYE